MNRCGRMAVYSQQPTLCWAPCCHGVCPCRWRPKRTACMLSLAPCNALPLYSWLCEFLVANKGKPWRHHVFTLMFDTNYPYVDHTYLNLNCAAFDVVGSFCFLVQLLEKPSFGTLNCEQMWTHGCVFSAAHLVLGTLLSWCMSM